MQQELEIEMEIEPRSVLLEREHRLHVQMTELDDRINSQKVLIKSLRDEKKDLSFALQDVTIKLEANQVTIGPGA